MNSDEYKAALRWLLCWHNAPYDIANCRPEGYGHMPEPVARIIKSICDEEAVKYPHLKDKA